LNRDLFQQWLCSETQLRRPLVMGVLNLTPDSFSDGGRYLTASAAVARVAAMIGAGADGIDCGAESTRPGASSVDADEQIRRLMPVLERARDFSDRVIFSVDTTNASVAEAALDAGFALVNDVSAGRDDPRLLPLVGARGAAVILMHMQGSPATMQQAPTYSDVVSEVGQFLRQRRDAAIAAGVDAQAILLDPGIGFGKTTDHNLELLNRLEELTTPGWPIVVGTSRKRFIGQITGVAEPSQRLFGTAATVAIAVARGAALLRVHDVEPMRQVVQMTVAILNAGRV
jgi:dihydropteroate synthase